MYNKAVTTFVIFAALLMMGSVVHAQPFYTTGYQASYSYLKSNYMSSQSSANFDYFGQRNTPILSQPATRTPSAFNFNYLGQNYAPVFQAPTYTPSNFQFDLRPVSFGPINFPTTQAAPTNFNFNLRPVTINPTYGPGIGGSGSGNINLNFAGSYFPPTYGPGIGGSGSGNINLNFAGPRIQPTYGQGMDGLGSGTAHLDFSLTPHYLPTTYDLAGSGVGVSSLFRGDFRGQFYTPLMAAPIYATPSRALFNTEFGVGTFFLPYGDPGYFPYWSN